MPTKNELITIAESVRETEVDDPHGQCFPASKALKKALANETSASKDSIEVEEVLMGPHATIRHYVVAYPANKISDVDTYGRVLIDITLDQYCTEFEDAGKVETSIAPRENIAPVNFYENKELSPYQ